MIKPEMLRPLFANPRLRPQHARLHTEINAMNETSRLFAKAVKISRLDEKFAIAMILEVLVSPPL